MKGKALVPLVLGLVIGLIAVKFVVDTVRNAQAAGESQEEITIVRAKEDIGAYVKITREMVETVQTVDSDLVPERDRIDNIEQVVDRVSGKAIPMYAPVLQSMLADKDTQAGMKGRIPPGFRAVTVEIDEVTGVAYQLQPGDWVDVIVVTDDKNSGRRREKVAKVILENVQVAAIGRSGASASEGSGRAAKPAKSATLLVPKDDAPALHLAKTTGKITLALRGDDDTKSDVLPSARSVELFSASDPRSKPARVVSAAIPDPPEDHTHQVVISRGGQTETITFENADSSHIVSVQETGQAKLPALNNAQQQSSLLRELRARQSRAAGEQPAQAQEKQQPDEDE